MFRAYAGCAIALFLVIAVSSIARAPAAGDVPPTFTPELTPPPSPTVLVTALPPPISRPEDAHGISATMSPLLVPGTFRPPALPPAQWLTNADSFSVPCSVHAQRVFVPAVVGGAQKIFVLGSAAQTTAIDYASVVPSPDHPIAQPTIQIGELRLNALVASVSRVEAFAQTYLGASADGVLGQELFARFPVKIDYRACSVTVFRDSATAEAEAERADASARQRVALTMRGGLPTVEAKLGTANAVLVMDTASDADVDVSQAFVLATHLTLAGPIVPELRRASPDGELHGQTSRISSLSIGSVALDAPVLGISSAPPRAPAGVAGFVGAGVLDRFVVLIDEPASTCVLTAQPPLPRSYDRSGLWLVKRQDWVSVRSVLVGSPASKAGIRPGDRIVSVNGQTQLDLETARALFAQAPGTTLSVSVAHGSVQRTVSLGLRTLI